MGAERRALVHGRLREWLREFATTWWLYPLAALALMLLVADLDDDGLRELVLLFAIFLFVSTCIGLVISALYAWIVKPLLRRFPSRVLEVVVHPLTLIFGLAIGTELAMLGLRVYYGPQFEAGAARLLAWKFGAGVGVILMLIGVTLSKLRERAHAEALREAQMQSQVLRARLQAVQSRTHPHFLFNSLNTIAALAEEDSALAVVAVERLSELLRYALEGSKRRSVPLGDELAAVRAYVEVEKLRFGDRLEVCFATRGAVDDAEIPPLLLQPVVENAIKHGVSRRGGGRVEIDVLVERGRIHVRVSDDGPGESSASGTSTGDADLREHLALVYGASATHLAGPRVDGGYGVDIELPARITSAVPA